MTEAEWLKAKCPGKAVRALRREGDSEGRILICVRKLRLFACACFRRSWDAVRDPRSREAAEASERFTDGAIDEEELRRAERRAIDALQEIGAEADRLSYGEGADVKGTIGANAAQAAAATGVRPDRDVIETLLESAHLSSVVALGEYNSTDEGRIAESAALAAEEAIQCDILRDLFGNPFSPVALDRSWLTSDVIALARSISAERAFDRLPILADTLQDAGCEDEQVLRHCRGPGPHVRGCWIVDLLTGRA